MKLTFSELFSLRHLQLQLLVIDLYCLKILQYFSVSHSPNRNHHLCITAEFPVIKFFSATRRDPLGDQPRYQLITKSSSSASRNDVHKTNKNVPNQMRKRLFRRSCVFKAVFLSQNIYQRKKAGIGEVKIIFIKILFSVWRTA